MHVFANCNGCTLIAVCIITKDGIVQFNAMLGIMPGWCLGGVEEGSRMFNGTRGK
jgi:hypothetical protein